MDEQDKEVVIPSVAVGEAAVGEVAVGSLALDGPGLFDPAILAELAAITVAVEKQGQQSKTLLKELVAWQKRSVTKAAPATVEGSKKVNPGSDIVSSEQKKNQTKSTASANGSANDLIIPKIDEHVPNLDQAGPSELRISRGRSSRNATITPIHANDGQVKNPSPSTPSRRAAPGEKEQSQAKARKRRTIDLEPAAPVAPPARQETAQPAAPARQEAPPSAPKSSGFYLGADGRLRRPDGKFANKLEARRWSNEQAGSGNGPASQGGNGPASQGGKQGDKYNQSLLRLTVKAVGILVAGGAARRLANTKAGEASGLAVGGSFFLAAKELIEMQEEVRDAFKERDINSVKDLGKYLKKSMVDSITPIKDAFRKARGKETPKPAPAPAADSPAPGSPPLPPPQTPGAPTTAPLTDTPAPVHGARQPRRRAPRQPAPGRPARALRQSDAAPRGGGDADKAKGKTKAGESFARGREAARAEKLTEKQTDVIEENHEQLLDKLDEVIKAVAGPSGPGLIDSALDLAGDMYGRRRGRKKNRRPRQNHGPRTRVNAGPDAPRTRPRPQPRPAPGSPPAQNAGGPPPRQRRPIPGPRPPQTGAPVPPPRQRRPIPGPRPPQTGAPVPPPRQRRPIPGSRPPQTGAPVPPQANANPPAPRPGAGSPPAPARVRAHMPPAIPPSPSVAAGANAGARVAERGGARLAARGLGSAALLGGARALPVVGQVLAAGLAVADGVEGYNDKEGQARAFDLQKGEEATTGQKAAMSLAKVLDLGGLTSGIAGAGSTLAGAMGMNKLAEALTFNADDMAKAIYAGMTLFDRDNPTKDTANRTLITNNSMVSGAPDRGRSMTDPSFPGTPYLPGAGTGGMEEYLIASAQMESGVDPTARNKSGAAGAYQFMPDTAAQYGLQNAMDPVQSTQAMIRFTQDNAAQFKKTMGRDATDREMYLMHQQGAGGATALLKNPNANAAQALGKNGMSKVLQNGGDLSMTAQEFMDLQMVRYDRAKAQVQASPEKQAQVKAWIAQATDGKGLPTAAPVPAKNAPPPMLALPGAGAPAPVPPVAIAAPAATVASAQAIQNQAPRPVTDIQDAKARQTLAEQGKGGAPWAPGAPGKDGVNSDGKVAGLLEDIKSILKDQAKGQGAAPGMRTPTGKPPVTGHPGVSMNVSDMTRDRG